MGAIKKFGKQILNKKEGTKELLANIMKMHNNYTFVTCTSNATKQFYKEAFGVEPDKILCLGMPRIDYLLQENKELIQEIKEEYPKLKEKKNILYVPTFRKGKFTNVQELIDKIDDEKYNLIIRLHPLEHATLDEKYLINEKYKTMDLLKIADYVITDYSAIAFETAVLNKPLFFYLYDIEEYNKNRGLNIDLKAEMPKATFETIEPIIETIEKESYPVEELLKFREKYVETIDTQNTKRIVELLLQ